jgi:hypothetical protein
MGNGLVHVPGVPEFVIVRLAGLRQRTNPRKLLPRFSLLSTHKEGSLMRRGY